MLEWLKNILGDKYTPEIDTAVSQEIGKGFVARADFNIKAAKRTELETEVTQLREGVKTRDKQLEELKKAAGDNADLKKQIEDLTQQNKDQKTAFDKELATARLMALRTAFSTPPSTPASSLVARSMASCPEAESWIPAKPPPLVGPAYWPPPTCTRASALMPLSLIGPSPPVQRAASPCDWWTPRCNTSERTARPLAW